MRVVLIGSGNVATVFGEKIVIAGHDVVQVLGRDPEKAALLAQKLGAGFCTGKQELAMDADLYLVAVSDRSIPEIAAWLRVQNKLVVHTAGSVQMRAIAACSSRYGVLYPLQTIRKGVNLLPEIPLLVDGESEETITTLFDFAGSISYC